MNATIARHWASLTVIERAVVEWLDACTPSRWAHNLCLTSTIAEGVGVCRRSVELALATFRRLGLVERVSGDRLRSLRRLLGWRPSIRKALRLLWRPFEDPSECARGAHSIVSPSHSPVLERERKKNDDDSCRDSGAPAPIPASSSSFHQEPTTGERLASLGAPLESLGASQGPAPLGQVLGRVAGGERSSSSPPPKQRKATAEEVEAVVGKARKAFPHVPCLDWKVKALAKQRRCDGAPVGLQWVDWALDWALFRGAVRWSFMTATIADWRENGPSGPPVARKPSMQNLNPPTHTPAEDSADDVEQARAWAAGRGPLARIGRQILARLGMEVPS